VVTALVAGGIGGGIGSWLETRDSAGGGTSVTASVNPKDLSRSPNSIAGIAARSLPSVVTISASNAQESGTGTGFVFDSRGYILTNNHVVAPSTGGGKLSVKFSDGNSYPATIVGRAQGYDVAVIKLAAKPKEKLVPLPLGNSDDVQVGDTTIAIGAPFGLSGTVTSGIISAKNRPVASGDESGTETSYMNALQTDASINPGNSGGPLMNASGQVIGIDSAIQSGGATDSEGQSGSVGLGFAIPINEADWVAGTLIQTGQPIYPIIGILRDDSYTGNGAKIASGPVQGQAAVTPGGPAAQAGLQAGDVITQFAGVQIDSGPTLVSEIWSHRPGDKCSVTYIRNGQTHTTTLTLGKRVGDAQ
jgi:putative serine protease PepD